MGGFVAQGEDAGLVPFLPHTVSRRFLEPTFILALMMICYPPAHRQATVISVRVLDSNGANDCDDRRLVLEDRWRLKIEISIAYLRGASIPCGVAWGTYLDKIYVSEDVRRGVGEALQELVLETLQLHFVPVGSLQKARVHKDTRIVHDAPSKTTPTINKEIPCWTKNVRHSLLFQVRYMVSFAVLVIPSVSAPMRKSGVLCYDRASGYGTTQGRGTCTRSFFVCSSSGCSAPTTDASSWSSSPLVTSTARCSMGGMCQKNVFGGIVAGHESPPAFPRVRCVQQSGK